MNDHWRNSQKIPRFFIFDARIFFVLLAFMMHIRLWTLVLALMSVMMFTILERLGLTFDASLRAMRCWFLGQNRPACGRAVRRYWIDYGSDV